MGGTWVLRNHTSVILDMDGCIYLGNTVIHGAPEAIRALRRSRKRVLFLTNNAGRTAREYVAKLSAMGIAAEEREILTSAEATAQHIKQTYGPARVYPIGTSALSEELSKAGHTIVDGLTPEAVDFVVAAVDFDFTYRKMKIASRALRANAKYIATNVDATMPVEDGLDPGAGAIVSAVSVASNVTPIIIGKPSKYIMDAALTRLGSTASETIVVGDRLDTDILVGNEIGATTILVLTGAVSAEEAANIKDPRLKPKLTLPSIVDLPNYI
ncbi:MAG: HAD-IIA family hydrolase [Candidatus Bathyarchaeia archaeon]